MTLIDEFRMLADDLYSVEGHNRYASALSKAADEIERLQSVIADLRVRIEAMEKQEPVATVRINVISGNPSVDFVPGLHYLHHNDKLYLAPGAKGEIK